MMKHRLFLLLTVASLAFVGCEKEITPSEGCFTISKTQQVKFAPGNLQVIHMLDSDENDVFIYQFAATQWEYLAQRSTAALTTFDLFGWGTGDDPSRSVDTGSYYPSFVDWGNNPIKDATGKYTSGWRTLTYEEWNYVINDRPNAAKLRCSAQIDGVPGMLLLPDTWSLGEVRHDFSANYSDTIFTTTDPSNTDWQKFEAAGAVFLPAAGVRVNSRIYGAGEYGRYWTSTENLFTGAFFFGFMQDNDYATGQRQWGFAVRLAKEQ